MKNIDELIVDIYNLLDPATDHKVSEESLDKFALNVKEHLKRALSEIKADPTRVLRMSSIGKKPRQLWYESRQGSPGSPRIKKFSGAKLISFLYGNIIEELVLFLAREAGHTVDREQKEVELAGVKGRLDCYIDDVLVDAKSASYRGFDKFKNGSLLDGKDDFGYVDQISGYAQAEGEQKAAFVALNKETGELALLKLHDLDLKNVIPKIEEIKVALSKDTPPPKCYPEVPDGASGNMTLHVGCSYCPYKMHCWKDANNNGGLRVFRYSTGPKFLTRVIKTPQVEEITKSFNVEVV